MQGRERGWAPHRPALAVEGNPPSPDPSPDPSVGSSLGPEGVGNEKREAGM